ncbi:MAG: hypothetical protein H8D45_21765 [Bacteroidetes bacterium]|nr:hypothetical protein [Bacteroidota bacterium]MBL7103667.1 hypothetical protein [Bacteroidales bacterium]
MKRFDEKIGKRIEKESEEEVARKRIRKLIAVLLILSLTACEKHAWYGRDGKPGDAYLSLTWQVAEPTYIDAGSGAIPPVFYWGQFYKIYPGYYDLYYEGRVWDGMFWASYAWEVRYEIWEVRGEAGDWYYNGADGPDNYFTIECNPYGPYIQSTYKSTELDSKYELIEENENEITVVQKGEGSNLKITYKKVESKNLF